MRTDTPQTIYLNDYQPPAYLVERIELTFELEEGQTRVSSRLLLYRNPQMGSERVPLVLDGERLELESLSLDGRPLEESEYRLDAHSLTIETPPARFELETRVLIHPEQNTALEGLYRSGGIYCTQCEAEGFRRITYFLDRPDVMARFSTRLIADRARYPVLLSNGNCVERRDLGGGRHLVRWDDPFPKPCYLFALVAGDLHCQQGQFTTCSGRQVELHLYVEPENRDKCEHALRSLQRAMAWDEERYGREYDLDIYMIVAVNDFNMGAMENKGLNIFNAKYVLARPETATDRDFQAIEGVIAHEYFHNWTGNRITCRDWFQLSLKEGLTVFRDQEFSADMGSRGVKRIEDVRLLRTHQFAEDAGPMAHPVRPESYMEISNFYTVTVYEKGAELVRMLHCLLGDEAFRRATDLYFERYDGMAVTTDDFVRCMEEAGGRDLQQFRLWYSQAGTPRVTVEAEYDGVQHRYRLHLRQTCPATPGQPHKSPQQIPIRLALLDDQGQALPLRLAGEAATTAGERVIELRAASETFEFVDIGRRPVPSLLRGFSAPVRLEYPYDDRELMFLMARDSDPFNRWDAAQTLAQRSLLELVEACRAGRPLAVDAGYVEAFRLTLEEQAADRALQAELLSLPSETALGELMQEVDVEAIHRAREWLKGHLADRLREAFEAVYATHAGAAGFDLDPASIGRRRLRNLALEYLMQLEDPAIQTLCMEQFETADNMTDRMAALHALANSDAPQRQQALSAFERRWRDDPLVMDKWFSVQAGSKRPGTLREVEALMRHPAFSLRNPNKVRSLIGVFCSANLPAFHAADGSGYRFLTDQVLALDGLNPQVAARMLRLMTRWRRYDPDRQRLMRAHFERVLARPGISRDLFEIASKSLGQG